MKPDVTITRDQFFGFIKKPNDQEGAISSSTQHYLDYFDKVQQTGKKGNWNWMAFSPLWFFYRRMILIGLAVSSCGSLLDKMIHFLFKKFPVSEWEDLLSFGVSLAFILLCMRYADYMYLEYAKRKIAEGKVHSGTTWLGVVIPLLLIFLIFSALVILKQAKA